jgi:tetratricopeptide (TPR) repeat protein
LIDAEAIISRGLKSHPNDPAWLQAKGHADLLAWNYDSAIRSFKQALDSTSNSPELEIDLASAFFERAEATEQYFDFGTALELLGKALDAQPDNAVALFNRAIIAERMRLYEQSIQDWEHYLRVDPDGEWAAEAQVHLESIQKKKSVR